MGFVSRSQRDVPVLQLFGNALDGLVGPFPFLLRLRLAEDFISQVVHTEQRIAIGSTNVLLTKSKNIIRLTAQ